MFEIGQKVVCVNDMGFFVQGEIYTVRAISNTLINLAEIPLAWVSDGCFKPLTDFEDSATDKINALLQELKIEKI